MGQFAKNVLIVLTLGIVVTSLISQSNVTASQSQQASMQETIDQMEDNIEAGIIINDGQVEDPSDGSTAVSGTNIGTATSKVGEAVSNIIAKIIEFFAKLFGKLVA